MQCSTNVAFSTYLEGCDFQHSCLQQLCAVVVDTSKYLTLAVASRKTSSCSYHVITLPVKRAFPGCPGEVPKMMTF